MFSVQPKKDDNGCIIKIKKTMYKQCTKPIFIEQNTINGEQQTDIIQTKEYHKNQMIVIANWKRAETNKEKNDWKSYKFKS